MAAVYYVSVLSAHVFLCALFFFHTYYTVMTTTTATQPAIYRLQAKTQSYDWGKLGDVSKVAQYAKTSGVEIDTSRPYAELWMGTHPNAPSVLMDEAQTPLKDLVKNNPQYSTQAIYDKYEGDLPFLFKILSIRKALSIQAHPDKTLGARLFKEFPNNYKVKIKVVWIIYGIVYTNQEALKKDPNHKVTNKSG